MTLAAVKFVNENVQSANSVAYVLDDDDRVASLVSRMLESDDFVAIAFNDPAICLKQLKSCDAYTTPKLFILDLSLGKTDGVEVLNHLAAAHYKGTMLLISGKDEATLDEVERMGSARGLRMLPSLKKPFRKDDLAKRIKIDIGPAKPAAPDPVTDAATASLDRALSTGGIILHYQTVVDLKTGSIRGAEAVLYERNPSSGLIPLSTSAVPPGAAILHPLSRFLLRTAMKDWQQHLSISPVPIRLSTKLPLSVVTSANFLALVREVLSPHPKFPGLIIEVDEWKLPDAKVVREAAARLKLYGVELAVSDIGAVFDAIVKSSRLPFAEFRLNSDFISNCSLNETKRDLCEYVIRLAHDAGVSVCAMGVMTGEEMDALVRIKCDTAQGRFLGAPQPVETFKRAHAAPMNLSGDDETLAGAEFEWPSVPGNG
jgi:EAL domain-containing protein (putative c-di-GMP-specific phosphodiesterase class I)/FixJ family two-component response regulator